MKSLILAAVLFLISALSPSLLAAQSPGATTQEIFKQFSEHVVRIEVVETGSAAKASVGTGFYATAGGHIFTNYHVVSKLIHTPDRYRIEITDGSGQAVQATILGVDVVYDLAVLRTSRRPKSFLALESKPVDQGTRLYSLGHPRDLGLTIVEGTYNGLLKHTLYPKVHFTGSLNPGMSGGPALTQAGRVVGVNVATEGEQISYLVPAERVVALLQRTANLEAPPPQAFLAEVGKQIFTNQARYLDGLFSSTTPSISVGPYSLPTKPADFFRCWADALRRKEIPYVAITHDCSTDDYLFVSSEQSSGIVRFYHQMLSTEELNPAQFFTLYSSQVQAGNTAVFGNEEEVTPFRCQTRNVRTQTGKVKAILCARQYVKLPGLYDAAFRVAAVGARNTGLVSTLSLSGASFDNIQLLTRRYMEKIQWRR
jgi:serine protease Do